MNEQENLSLILWQEKNKTSRYVPLVFFMRPAGSATYYVRSHIEGTGCSVLTHTTVNAPSLPLCGVKDLLRTSYVPAACIDGVVCVRKTQSVNGSVSYI